MSDSRLGRALGPSRSVSHLIFRGTIPATNLTVRWQGQLLTNPDIKLSPAMANPLSSYLSDHLAGAKFAIELLEDMRDGHRSESLTNFAAKMLTDVAADAAVLQELSELAGGGSVLKKAGALLAEWAAQLKFRFGTDAELGNFEALEVLSLGILGKLKLWTALAEIAPFDNRLNGLDLPKLIQRAKTQHDEVEVYRLAAATKALKQFHSAPS